jgi:hypothetical protein
MAAARLIGIQRLAEQPPRLAALVGKAQLPILRPGGGALGARYPVVEEPPGGNLSQGKKNPAGAGQ